MISAKKAYEEAKAATRCDKPYDYFTDAIELDEISRMIFNGSKNGDMEIVYGKPISSYIRKILEEEGYELKGNVISWAHN